MEVSRRVVVMNMMSVVFRLTFTWLSPWGDGVTEQWLATALQILWVHSQEVLQREMIGKYLINVKILMTEHLAMANCRFQNSLGSQPKSTKVEEKHWENVKSTRSLMTEQLFVKIQLQIALKILSSSVKNMDGRMDGWMDGGMDG